MMNIGDIFDYCEDHECELCVLCPGCEDYNGHGICLSNGRCGKEKVIQNKIQGCEEHPAVYEIETEGVEE